MSRIAFSIVLPCYNEAQNLPLILEGYRKVWHESCELILVNNGSTDNTAQVLEEELGKAQNAFARSVSLPVNQGYGYGVMAGIRDAKGEVIGISHADMQCPPADLFRAYDLLAKNKNAIVKGKRGKREFSASVITAGMATIATSVLMKRLTDVNAQPKVFPRILLEHMTEPPDGFELDLYILYSARKLGWKVLELPVVFGQRAHGTSKWAFSLASRRRHMWATLKYIFRLRFSHA